MCINQRDGPEKNVQVDMMRSVHHSTAWVVACLNCGPDAISIIQTFGLLLTS